MHTKKMNKEKNPHSFQLKSRFPSCPHDETTGADGTKNGARCLEGWNLTKQDGGDPPLGIHGEAFIEPELPPVGIGDQVPKPTVGDLMDDDVS